MTATPQTPTTSSAAASPRVRRPLFVTLGLVALLAALLPAIAAAVLLAGINLDAVKEDAKIILDQAVLDAAHTVERSLADSGDALTAVATVFTDRALAPEARLATARALVSAARAIDAVGVYDKQGTLIDAIVEDGATAAVPERLDDALWLRVQSGGPVVGDSRSNAAGRIEVFVAARIFAGGSATGAVAAWVDVDDVQQQLVRTAELAFGGRRHSLFVVDAHDNIVADVPRPTKHTSVAADPILVQVRAGNGNAHVIDDDERAAQTWASQNLSGSAAGFVVVATMPHSVVYASANKMKRAAAMVIVVAGLLAVAGAVLVARSITRPVAALALGARALAERRFDDVVTLKGRADELALLGDSMVKAAFDLKEGEQKLLDETRLREGLGRYLPGQLVDAYVKRQHEDLLTGKRADITILFADVVGFTPLAAKLPPEELCKLLNDLFTILTEIVFKHGGTVDKFIGDSVMAFWGAPLPQEDHAKRAIEAARDMMRFLDVGNARWKKRHGIQIQLAIGINSGSAVVGNLGSEKRLVYTAIGEAVNVAARLETVAGPMQILTSGETLKRVGVGARGFLPLGPQPLKGVSDPVDVFAVEV